MARLSCIMTIISIVLTCVLAKEVEEFYSDQYDDVYIANILENENLRKEYYDCFMETSPCVTADVKFFKEVFSEAIQTKCKRCTEKQKENMNLIVDWYTENKPEEWETILAKTIENLKKENEKEKEEEDQ